MRSRPHCIRRTPVSATRHLRPVLTGWLSRAVRLPTNRRTCTPATVWSLLPFAAAFARYDSASSRAWNRPVVTPMWTAVPDARAIGSTLSRGASNSRPRQ